MQRSKFFRRTTPRESAHAELFRELDEAKRALWQAQSLFDNTSDPSLLDERIYELCAREARYRCLLRRVKDAGATAAGSFVEGATWV